jgi:uncharacterized protein
LACLSSRIAVGEPVTAEKLRRVEMAEAWLRARGFAHVRVRVEPGGLAARIEVEPSQIPRLRAVEPEARVELERLGFARVEVDARGYRASGLPTSRTAGV